MITRENDNQIVGGKLVTTTTFYGLSTETAKPSDVANGSCFIEMDTGKVYFYDASEGGSGWIEWGAST